MIALVVACVLVVLLVPATAEAATRSERAVERGVAYLLDQQVTGGGFAEAGGRADPSLTAWVILGLRASGRTDDATNSRLASAGRYLAGSPHRTLTGLELKIMALAASGQPVAALVDELRAAIRPSGQIGPALNSTFWGVLALSSAGERVPASTVRFIRSSQHRSGGFSWFAGGRPDTNDTAAAIQALIAAGLPATARPIRRALRYLSRQRKSNGGFPLSRGGRPDAQSAAWVLQAHAAVGRKEPRKTRRFLLKLQHKGGRVRYQPGRTISPVWVTSQAVVGLAKAPFPLTSFFGNS